MTDTQTSLNFLYGMTILAKYRTDKFTVNVVERSAINVEGLSVLNKQDEEDMKLFNWEIESDSIHSFAYFHKLKYVDY